MELALKARWVGAAAGLMSLVVWAQPAFCHHSFAMYDQTIDKTPIMENGRCEAPV
ncbi:MAG TPA: hypothetical protein VIM81_14885 [Gammaproteobacteria bacterium]